MPMKKISFSRFSGFDRMRTIVEVELDDGRVASGAADFGKGSPANPMSDEEVAEKFRGCAAWGGLERARADALLARAWRIEELPDVRELAAGLRVDGG